MIVPISHAVKAIYTKLIENQVAIFLLGTIAAGNYTGVIGLVISFWLMALISGYSESITYYEELQDSWSSFFRKSNLRLSSVELGKVVTPEILKNLDSRPSFRRPNISGGYGFLLDVVPVRVFYVQILQPPAPTEWMTYTSTVGTRFIFILENPDSLSVQGKFRLFHELHHGSPMGVTGFMRFGSTTLATLELMLIPIMAWFGNGTVYDWILLSFLLFVSYRWQKLFTEYLLPIHSEVGADVYALKSMSSSVERLEVLKNRERIWGREIRNTDTSFLRKLELKLRLSAIASLNKVEIFTRMQQSQEELSEVAKKWSNSTIAKDEEHQKELLRRTNELVDRWGENYTYILIGVLYQNVIRFMRYLLAIGFFAIGWRFAMDSYFLYLFPLLFFVFYFSLLVKLYIDRCAGLYKKIEKILLEKGLATPRL